MAKKKHKTPSRLDYLFERKLITKSQYREFWEGYWGETRQRSKDNFVDQFILDLQSEESTSGTITRNREAAEEQARKIGGYVVRRNAKGRFSKTGHSYQAVVRKKGKRK
jgi:hypothetical protein